MTGPVAVDVALSSPLWRRNCPGVRGLARQAARLALRRAGKTSGLLEGRPVELAVTLADDAFQARLNRRYRGREGATNVLSFAAGQSLSSPAQSPLLLGDVVLAFETALREAEEQEKPLADHLRHLVVHGVLHLLGFDHEKEPQASAMEAFETSILGELGVPDPYRDTMSTKRAPSEGT